MLYQTSSSILPLLLHAERILLFAAYMLAEQALLFTAYTLAEQALLFITSTLYGAGSPFYHFHAILNRLSFLSLFRHTE